MSKEPFGIRIKLQVGQVEYKSTTEEWTVDGSVEGRMALPLAMAIISCMARMQPGPEFFVPDDAPCASDSSQEGK